MQPELQEKRQAEQISRYREDLPTYLQSDPVLVGFLLAFEKVLSGFPQETKNFKPQHLTGEVEACLGLETVISNIHTYFDPHQTPTEFLPWLAGWVALSLRDDWNLKVKQNLISQIVPLYQIRGTVPGLKKMLQIYLENSGLSYPGRSISVFEFDDRPHYFQVQLVLPSNQVLQPKRYWQEYRAAKAIIDQEKPAHTFYALRILTLTMRLTKAWGLCYPFTLFDLPPRQIVQIEATVQLTAPLPDSELEGQILIRIQGKQTVLEPNGSQLGATVRQMVFYDQLLANPEGYFVALANLSDRYLAGILTINLNFNLNGQWVSHPVLESPFRLEPNLRIYRPYNHLESMPGNTRLDSDPERTLRLEPGSTSYQSRITPIDGNTRLGTQVGHTMRLVHDARLRIYLPRPRFNRGSTRLGSSVGQTMQLPRDRENPGLQIYHRDRECRVGNTQLGSVEGDTMRLVSTSAWLERIYRFRLFEPPATRQVEIEVLIEPRADSPENLDKISRLLIVRMQSCTSSHSPFTPELEYTSTGIRATHRLTYQRFLENPQGFYVVMRNLNDCSVTGKLTIKFHFRLNGRLMPFVAHVEDFNVSPRDHALQICRFDQSEDLEGNTILGRLTPYMVQQSTPQEEAWID